VQGIGAALLVPQSLAIIAANFPKDIRGRAIGTWASASAVTTALGPPLGGLLIDTLSWRAAFWINLPLSALAVWLAWRHVPESRDATATGAIDWRGSLTAVVAFGALTYALSRMSESGASPLPIGAAIAVGIAGIALFVSVERRADNPIAAPVLFRSRVFTVVNVVTVLLYGALSGVLFLLPFDLLSLRGMTATEAGLTLLPLGIIIGIFSRFAGGLADKFGTRLFLALGSTVVAVGCLGFAGGQENLWVGAVLPLILLSGGMAIVVSPLTTAVMNAAPDEKAGAASGVSNAASRLAGVLAVAVFGTIAGLVFAWLAPEGTRFGVLPEAGLQTRAAAAAAFVSAYSVSMIIAALWAAVAAAAAFFLLPDDRPAEAKQAPA
jgi:MFS family permease